MTDEESERLWNEVRDHPLHFDRLGVPISLREWCELIEDRSERPYKRIASTTVGGWWISTIWTGLDGMAGLFGGPPRIFETMVFDARDGQPKGDFEQRRYATEKGARQGHEEMVQLVMTLENIDPARSQARLDDL